MTSLPSLPVFGTPPEMPGSTRHERPRTVEEKRTAVHEAMEMTQDEVRTWYRRLMIVKEEVRRNPFIPVDPTEKQCLFLALTVTEALFGGAAGPGKELRTR